MHYLQNDVLFVGFDPVSQLLLNFEHLAAIQLTGLGMIDEVGSSIGSMTRYRTANRKEGV